jgi:asparaginyl-tRNA synthetase
VRTSKGGFAFLSINDGSSFDGLQIVAGAELPNYDSEIVKLTTGCAVEVEGTVVASQGKNQEREIQATRVTLIGAVEDPETYPIAKKRHTFEYLRTVAHLRPRTNTFGAIARLRNSIAQAVHGYFHRHGEHADHYRKRLRRCGSVVSRQHARCAQSAACG